MSLDSVVNTSTSTTISIHNRGEGYSILAPKQIETVSPQVAIFLSRTLERWIKENGIQVRAAVVPYTKFLRFLKL
jgi:hypothetical protein